MIYFDHNASTAVDERVLEAMLPYFSRLYGNPSSLYRLGRIARSAIDTAREQVAVLVSAQPEQVIFTSGGTEANALAIGNAKPSSAVAISAIEHPSVTENARRNLAAASQILPIAVDGEGRVQLSALQQYDPKTLGLVSVMLANNETGGIQDIAAIADYCQLHRITMHTDAVQALGKVPVSFPDLRVQMMSLSSHKIYGPKGCGALVIAKDFPLRPLMAGGDQEYGLRSGTENVAAIVGFGKAAELARLELMQRGERLRQLREQLERRLRDITGAVIFAEAVERLPNTVQFAIAGLDGQMLLMQLDQQQIAVSSGSACAVGDEHISPVLAAMGVPAHLAKGAVRISLGKDNHADEIEHFIQVLNRLVTDSQRFA
jgi:cysteine desulfurase